MKASIILCLVMALSAVMFLQGANAQEEIPSSTSGDTTTSVAESSSTYFVSPGTVSDLGNPWPHNDVNAGNQIHPSNLVVGVFALGAAALSLFI